ncbi:hypothetical protein PMAYCL1PPCAC_25458, partial [Pristionchus mayeri]
VVRSSEFGRIINRVATQSMTVHVAISATIEAACASQSTRSSARQASFSQHSSIVPTAEFSVTRDTNAGSVAISESSVTRKSSSESVATSGSSVPRDGSAEPIASSETSHSVGIAESIRISASETSEVAWIRAC